MPLTYLDLKNVYPYSTGFYFLANRKNSATFKIGSARKLVTRINNGYTLCYMPTGFYLFCIIRLKQRYKSTIITLEHNLFKFLERKGLKRVKSSVRTRKTEWFKCKKSKLEEAVKEWVELNKQKIIFIQGNYNAIGDWNGLKIASPIK